MQKVFTCIYQLKQVFVLFYMAPSWVLHLIEHKYKFKL